MKKPNRAYSIQNVLTKKFHPLGFEGKYKDAFGDVDKAFSAIFIGKPKNGKTEAAIQFGKYLTNFGSVAYNSLEQGLSATIKSAFKRNDLANCKNPFLLLDREAFEELIIRFSKPKSPDFLVIDSVQYLRINSNQYYQLKELMLSKNKGIIWISQAKGKEPKGTLADAISYDVDIKNWIEGFKLFPETRYEGGGNELIIYPREAAIYWHEII